MRRTGDEAEPTADEVVGLLLEVMRRMKAHVEAQVAAHELSAPQASVLRCLAAGPGQLSQRELAAHLHCDASNVTGLVDRLESRGLVERRVSSADRRVKTVVVTKAGTTVHRRLERAVATDAPLVTALDPEEQRALRDLLRKILETD